MHHPRKRFGQHFLTDENIIEHLVEAIAPKSEDHLIEIGGGMGALTKALLPCVKQLEVIELDRDLIAPLQNLPHQNTQLIIHPGDALAFDFTTLKTDARLLRICGNLPYNISTPLLFHLLTFAPLIEDMHFMLQKEVAERMVAQPGSKLYGRLSVMLQYHCQATWLLDVPKEAFSPPPKVQSAFIRLKPIQAALPANNLIIFADIVRQAFSQRRKMLHNSLHLSISADALANLGIDPNTRAEQLSINDFVRISNAVLYLSNKP